MSHGPPGRPSACNAASSTSSGGGPPHNEGGGPPQGGAPPPPGGVAPAVERRIDALRREAVVARNARGVRAAGRNLRGRGHRGSSVGREPLLGLGQGTREAGGVRQPRRAVGSRVDAQVQTPLIQDRHRHQLVRAPELGFVVVGLLRARDDRRDLAHRVAPCCWAGNRLSKSVAPMRAPAPGVSSPPCAAVPKYSAWGSPTTVRSSPVAAKRRRAHASMPSASGPPSSTWPPTGTRVARSATVAATSSAATSCISPVERRTVSPSAPASAICARKSKNCVERRTL